jgi:hypothetical protein
MLASRTKKALQISKLTNQTARGFRYETPDPYNKRWHWDLKYAYYSFPKDADPSKVEKPEDSRETDGWFANALRHWTYRMGPGVRQFANRAYRCATPYEMYLLPALTFIPAQFATLDLGFQILTLLPLTVLYTRVRDKLIDPQPEETYLLEMIHTNPVIKKHFAVETMQIMDHQMDYTKGFPDETEFPEFKNKLFSKLTRILQRRHLHDQGPLHLRRPRDRRHHAR